LTAVGELGVSVADDSPGFVEGPSAALSATVATLICRLERAATLDTSVIEWGCPVLSFGDLSSARVATVGLNPSNREFVDERGQELAGRDRRFDTLGSLGIPTWLDADFRHMRSILESCQRYFCCNPYDLWFRKLDQLINATGSSFYGPAPSACHLDLIPFATSRKWTELSVRQRNALLSVAADTLALLLRDSRIEVLILNGRSVVEHFQSIAGFRLDQEEIPGACLRRKSNSDVVGYGFRGRVSTLSGIPLEQEVQILGYNHNLQSSFGVSRAAVAAIREWVAQQVGGCRP
jgi:hypothetical protein